MYYNLILVVSEDYIDNDWNDAAVTLTWWVPSQTRSLSEFNVEAKVTGDSLRLLPNSLTLAIIMGLVVARQMNERTASCL